MNFITVGQLKQQIEPKLHGTTLDSVPGDMYDKLYEASQAMLARIDPDATIRKYRIANAIYSDITNYTLAADCKGKQKIMDIRPIGPRKHNDLTDGRFTREFDVRKEKNTMTIETINGIRTLRLSKCVGPMYTVWEADSLTLGATVTPLGDATNLTSDDLDFVAGISSIAFDLTGATGQGGVAVQLQTSVDLSSLLNLGALFNWVEFPDTNLQSVELRWGNNAGNYWSKTVTHAYDSTFTITGGTSQTPTALVASETPVGIVNGVNKVFTVSNLPVFINVDGQVMNAGNGYILNGLTVTFNNAPSAIVAAFYNTVGTIGNVSPTGVNSPFNPNAWNLQEFNWKGATKVGSPDSTLINDLEVRLNYTPGTPETGVHLDNVIASLGAAYEVVYYSNAIFLGTDGVYRTRPVSDDDQITLDESANTILLYEMLRVIYPELKGKSMGADIGQVNYRLEGDGRMFRGKIVMNYVGLYRFYLEGSPSESQSHQETYHQFDSLSGEGNG